jgi:hypothetical protein
MKYIMSMVTSGFCFSICRSNHFQNLKVLYEEPQQCFDCGNTVVIDVSVMLMPPCFQIGKVEPSIVY